MIKSVCIWKIHRNLTYTGYESASISFNSEHFSISRYDDKESFKDIYYAKDDTDFTFEYKSGSGNTRIEFSYQDDNLNLIIESNEQTYTHWSEYSGLGSFNISLNFNDYDMEDNCVYDFRIKHYLEANEEELDKAVRKYMEALEDWRYDNNIIEDE